ncbi:MAG: hypothetical protein OEY11_03275 [Gammaproteobacteria bacterium]|nr:hypothetical protein [Gammaproteobacteria bacterium]
MKTIIMLSLLLFSAANYAAEKTSAQLNHGQNVHQNHCLKCHTASIYTRENRVVKSINALGKQVRICRDNTNAPWFNEDTDAVINFLNKKYYQF